MQGCCTLSSVLYEPSVSHVLHNCMYSRLPWIAVNFDVPIKFFLSCDTVKYAIVRSSFCVCTLWQPSRVFVNFDALCFSACCSQMELVPINFFLSCDTVNYAIVGSSFCVCTLWQPSRVFVNFDALCFSTCCSQMEHSRSCYLMSTVATLVNVYSRNTCH